MATQITLQQLADEFRLSAVNVRRTKALLSILSVAAKADVKSNFAGSHDPDGKPWRPLAFPRARGGTLPLRDRGLLMASVASGPAHVERLTDTEVVIGTNRPGAALHQMGGTVRPTKGQFLAIPKTPEAARVTARNFPRKLFGLFGSKGGVLVESIKARGKKPAREVVHYALVRSVVVPARPFLGFGKRLIDKLTRLAQDWLAKELGVKRSGGNL